ncbi:MAG: hypothetical protein WC554_09150 [Clostridia bacterium]
MNRIEMIHEDFDTAVETLVKIADRKEKTAKETTTPSPQNDYEDGKWLESIGFRNTVKAAKAKEFDLGKGKIVNLKTANENEAKAIKEIVERYRQLFPFHKFILYSQVINICEKYNLVFAPSEMYKGDIPAKNITELKKFDFTTYKNTSGKIKPEISSMKPICAQNLSAHGYDSEYFNLFICAPHDEFIVDKNTMQVGKELYHCDSEFNMNPLSFITKLELTPKPKDPIILLPVTAFELGQIGFIVVTKWGIEANDVELQVSIVN